MSRYSRDKKEEILGLLLLAIGLLTLLSLLPQWLANNLSQGPEAEYRNLVGLAGKYINKSLKDLLGILAYSLPVLLAVWGWRIFRGKGSPVYLRITVGVVVLGLGLSIMLGLVQTGFGELSFDFKGGALGNWIAGGLITLLGTAGSYLITVLALFIFLIIYTGLSLRTLVEKAIKVAVLVAGAFKWAALAARPKKGVAKEAKKPQAASKEVSAAGVKRVSDAEPIAESPRSGEERLEQADFDFDLGPLSTEQEESLAGKDLKGEPGRGAQAAEAAPSVSEPFPEPGKEAVLYELPSIELLDPVEEDRKVVSQGELEKMGRVLMAKLTDFNVEGELINITRGPQVSTFEIRPAAGVKVNRIAALTDDLAMAMHAKRIRILAPIPGKGVVGVELPNPVLELVRAREIFESPVFRDSNYILPLGLGKDLEGQIRVAELTRMPHLLIAGTTGSGKSVCMNMIIASLLFLSGPERVGLLMIDPKMIELTMYNGIPHLLHPVITEAKEAARILKWTAFEMEQRYRMLSRNSVRNIEDFNFKVLSGKPVRPLHEDSEEQVEQMPYIIIVVDELSDLMCSDVKNEIEASLVRLAQMARAVGIHLVVATQRPSVDVITGLIKANFPSRLSFQVYSKIDSRTILDISGAEQLLRNGDMLFMPTGQAEPVRIQGAYLSSAETERLAAHWKAQPVTMQKSGEAPGSESYPKQRNLLEDLERQESGIVDDSERDELFGEAAKLVVRHDQGSTSLIQRRLKVGYARAGRIVDQLERAGILGPPDGSKAREVLVTVDELQNYGIE
ncbi:MAG TPA: DNA translocase FtsK [archaeon]|nr:DNA translocase FtsK [archaeon]